MKMKTYGFIISVCIKYNEILTCFISNLKSIIKIYPEQSIVLINDGSSVDNWKKILSKEVDMKNIIIEDVDKKLQGKGEINPYYYFYHNKYFDNAIILHDGTKALCKIPNIDYDLKYIWYFNYHYDWGNSKCPERIENSNIKTHEDEILYILGQIKDKKLSKELINTYFFLGI